LAMSDLLRDNWKVSRTIASRIWLKSESVGPSLAQGNYRVVLDMKRTAKARHQCRRCPLRAPSGRCLDPALKSGRCGDWIWYMRGSKQCRRRYTRPKDPHTLAQLLCRARFGAVSRRYSRSLADEEREACIATGVKLRSRPRLNQSGPLTGQQYWVRKDSAHARMNVNPTKAKTAPQLPQPQGFTRSTSGTRRGTSVVLPVRHRLTPRLARNVRLERKLVGRRLISSLSRRALPPPGHAWRTPRVTRNTGARRLRRCKAAGAVAALK
jgi:hypothetical protein